MAFSGSGRRHCAVATNRTGCCIVIVHLTCAYISPYSIAAAAAAGSTAPAANRYGAELFEGQR